jgi:hypothetical protein
MPAKDCEIRKERFEKLIHRNACADRREGVMNFVQISRSLKVRLSMAADAF